MADEEDLESYWGEVRKVTPAIKVVSGRATRVYEGLEIAAAKSAVDLATKFKDMAGKSLSSEGLAKLIAAGVQIFIDNWYNDLRHREPATLVEIVLEGQTIPIEELKGFVRALPMSLLKRILEEGAIRSTGSGIHALLAFEHHHRVNRGRDYELRRDPLDGKLVITSYPVELNGDPLVFKLDEEYSLKADAPARSP